MRDDSEVVVRPIGPQDKAGLADGLARMSADSRYRRFLTTVDEFSPADLSGGRAPPNPRSGSGRLGRG